jgi:actin-related protein
LRTWVSFFDPVQRIDLFYFFSQFAQPFEIIFCFLQVHFYPATYDMSTVDQADVVNDVIVVHIGSETMQYGLAGDYTRPREVERTMVGHPLPGTSNFRSLQSVFVGEQAWSRRGYLKSSFPVAEGVMVAGKETDYEILLQHAYNSSHRFMDDPIPLLLTETYLNSASNREFAAEIAFEKLQTPSFAILNQQLLALQSFGLSSGVVVDFGLESTRIVPIYNDRYISAHIWELGIGGTSISRQLMKFLSEDGWSLAGSHSVFEEIDEMKKSVCCVSQDYQADLVASLANPAAFTKTYSQSKHSTLSVVVPAFKAPETYFTPSLANLDPPGLIQRIIDAVSVNVLFDRLEHRPCTSLQHVCLTGGPSILKGMSQRIQSELDEQLGTGKTAVETRNFASWIGASMLASNVSRFNQVAISKALYEECGPSVFETPVKS